MTVFGENKEIIEEKVIPMVHTKLWQQHPAVDSPFHPMTRPTLGANLYSEKHIKPEPLLRPDEPSQAKLPPVDKKVAVPTPSDNPEDDLLDDLIFGYD